MRSISTLLLSLSVTNANLQYHTKEGPCPVKPGEVWSNVKGSLNAYQMSGVWVNIFDRILLNDHHKCYGIKLMHEYLDEADASDPEKLKDARKVFEYMKSTSRAYDLPQDDP